MTHPLAVQPLADAVLGQDVDGAVLDDAGADPRLDVLARPVLDDDRLDAVLGEDLGEEESGGTGADDGDLGAHAGNAGRIRAGATRSGFHSTEADQVRHPSGDATRQPRAGPGRTCPGRGAPCSSPAPSAATTSSPAPRTGTASEQVP